MQANPRRVADDDIKATADGDVRKMSPEREWQRGAITQLPLASRDISDLIADGQQTQTRVATGQVTIAEEISRAQHKQQLLARRGQSRTFSVQDLDRGVTLSAIHRFRESFLSRP
jgi:hypothetical protein